MTFAKGGKAQQIAECVTQCLGILCYRISLLVVAVASPAVVFALALSVVTAMAVIATIGMVMATIAATVAASATTSTLSTEHGCHLLDFRIGCRTIL